MFSGIVTAITDVVAHKREGTSLFLTFTRPADWEIKLGDSISTNGTCLTVQALTDTTYTTELMAETLKKTTFGEVIPERVNLEQSLVVGDKIDGHFVTGHIDAIGKVIEVAFDGSAKMLKVCISQAFIHLVAPKGSITVDGVALTVVDVGADFFTVWLVSYTQEHTTFGSVKEGSRVNIEFDVLAKYINRMISVRG